MRRIARYGPELFRATPQTGGRITRHANPPSTGVNVPVDCGTKSGDCEALLAKLEAVVDVGGEAWVEGSGVSMWPSIRPGDRVLLGAPTDIRVGSIVLVPRHGRAVLHRVRSMEGDSLRTAGDATLIPDAPVNRTRVVARALAAERNGALVALVPTLRFGLLPLARHIGFTARRRAADLARTVPLTLRAKTQ